MKLVASAKLRKAQKAIEALRPYERTLAEILSALPVAAPSRAAGNYPPSTTPTHAAASVAGSGSAPAEPFTRVGSGVSEAEHDSGAGAAAVPAAKTAIVAIASNSSLCGGFNANVLKKAVEAIRGGEGEVELYPIGRKMADGLRRAGYSAAGDWNDLIGHPGYDKSAALARSLSERFLAGEIARVVLVYTRFKSASSQEPVVEEWLPFAGVGDSPLKPANDGIMTGEPQDVKYILEPDAEALVAQLLPQVMLLKFHAAILDSAAAEQAARTIAMQTATDNAEDLLGELTLEYNKGRQQKITAEILDLLGGDQNR